MFRGHDLFEKLFSITLLKFTDILIFVLHCVADKPQNYLGEFWMGLESGFPTETLRS